MKIPEHSDMRSQRLALSGRRLLVASVGSAALTGFLFGFDTAVIAGVTDDLARVFDLNEIWLGTTVSVALWGTLIGALGSGRLGDRYGSRSMLRLTALLYLVSALLTALAPDWLSFVVGRFVGGLAIGASSVLAPVYIAEIAAPDRRGRLVGLFQLSIVAGILLAYFSNGLVAAVAPGPDVWRVKLGVAALPALFLVLLLGAAPQTPRWLLARGRADAANSVADRLGIARAQIRREPDIATGRLSLAAHGRLIWLAISLAAFNQLSGINAILYYLNDIFAAAGFASYSADRQAMVVGAVNFAATLIGMVLIDRVGRRVLLQVGALGTMSALLTVACVQWQLIAPLWLLPALIGFIASFALSQGAVIWVYLSEIFPQDVRAQGAAIGSATHWLLNAVIAALFPAIAAMSGGAPFVFFAAMMLVQFVVVRRAFPETKGMSLERTAGLAI